MKIQSNNFNGSKFPQKPRIQKHHTARLAFNFSFLTRNKQYNLDKNSKNVNKTIKLKLLEKITALSKEDKIIVLSKPKAQGLELLPESQVSLSVNSEFKNSGRFDECEDDYWVFRLSDKGRVIGKISDNILYILAIDPKFDLYKH